MGKLACFPVFVRKNKVKGDGHLSVQAKHHVGSCQIDGTTCSGMINLKTQDKPSDDLNFSKDVSTGIICLDVAVPSKLPVWSTYGKEVVDRKESKTEKEMGNMFSAADCPIGSVVDPGNPLELKSMADFQKCWFKGSGSDSDFSFGQQIGSFGNEASVDIAYEGGDEDEILSSTREQLDHDKQRNMEDAANSRTIMDNKANINDNLALFGNSNEITFELNAANSRTIMDNKANINDNLALFGNSNEITFELNNGSDEFQYNEELQNGHLSDPGDYKMGNSCSGSTSPVFQRSCSGSKLETRILSQLQAGGKSPNNCSAGLPPSNSQSFEDLQVLAGNQRGLQSSQSSPQSELTFCSADKVMLRRRSSSKVLPSRGRKFWWKIFLWSHRNLHKGLSIENTQPVKSKEVSEATNKKEGYSSDTLDVCRTMYQIRKEGQSPDKLKYEKDCIDAALAQQNALKTVHSKHMDWEHPSRVSGSWPFNQWVAFSAEQSNLARVEEWVSSIDSGILSLDNEDPLQENACNQPEGTADGSSIAEISEVVENVDTNVQDGNFSEEMRLANSAIRSLNAFSTVAHISGIGLSVIPMLSPFSSLRTINLSGNFIVRVTPGSLPRSLHTLNLSRNKITNTEGFRELTRLRVLDLSYNRISRIGHGLVNCTLIKELYLAGNKISDAEGLHRLLKLTVLDLSFNKITTLKALGQLAANYNSLMALNLLGNPVHTNVGDEQLRKSISSLLPHLAYLNKQPIKTVSAREAVVDSIARAALGNSAHNFRHKSSRRGSHASISHKAGSSIRRGSRSSEGPNRTQGLHSKHAHDKGKSRQEHLPARRASVPLMISDHQRLNNIV